VKAQTDRRLRDPFGENIVNEPRQIESAVESLNADALKRVLSRFDKLETQPVPRLKDAPNAVVVLSPEPGYGKSHLIGRLFRKLDDRATLIYVRPYQDANSCWIAILERIVMELNYPDDAEKVALEPGDVSQLDTLARRVMVHLVCQLLENGKSNVADPKRARDFFMRFPNAVFETPEWRSWLDENFGKLLPALDAMLASAGVQMAPNRAAWLRVLFKYAFSEHDFELRQICLEWLRYEPISEPDGVRIGVRLAELPKADAPWEERNRCCFERIRDLFQIAAYYRPFLLCFDQTELYGSGHELARSLGMVLSRLRRETKNHLTIVTGNQFVWNERVLAHFEVADQHGLDDPIHLEGVREAQARELLSARLEAWKIPKPEQEQFLGDWLPQLFDSTPMRGARHVLREASLRWSNPAPPTPKALFEAYRQRLLADPKRLDFDSGVFQLVCEQVLGPSVGVEVSALRNKNNPKAGYLSMQWTGGDADVLLGFEPGSHWKTWEAIVREAKRYHDTRKIHGRTARASLFRTSGQRPIPERSRSAIKDSRCVQLLDLTHAEAASIYAAHDLFADVQQGNHEVAGDSVLAFLREELKPQAARVLRFEVGKPPTIPPGPGLEEAIRGAVQTMKFATLDMLLERLKGTYPDLTPDSALEACQKVHTVRVVTSPNSVLLRWIQSASA
jgi:hypothetical protein